MKRIVGLLGVAALACAALAQSANAQSTYVFDVTGIQSWGGGFGHPDNEVFLINLGADAHIIGIGWDVTITAFSPSWLSEMRVEITDSAIAAGVGLTVGNINGPGTASYSSGGIVDLIDLNLDFNVGGDGLLRLEFWDTFNDNHPGGPDGVWDSGTITIQYIPAPGALALLGLAGLAGVTRRRR